MAENKKGFVLYADLIHTINKMPSEKAGDLFKHILSYVNDKNPQTDDILIDLVFEPIKQQLKRDLKKYEDKKVQWSDAGKRSAELRKAKKDATESTDVESRSTESTVIVKDNVKDNDIYLYTENDFLQRWKDARLYYDKKPTNITKLETYEKVNFNIILQNYKKEDIDKAISGLFFQETYLKTRVRPTHFLELSNFETYLTCWNTKEKLFKKPSKKYNDSI